MTAMELHDPSDERYMTLALEEARSAGEAGDVPIGALLVSPDGRIIGRGRNRREVAGDPTAHAEIEALRSAEGFDGWRRERCTMYVTLEPCPMCMGALVNARVARLVFGAADLKAGAARTLYRLGEDSRLNHSVLTHGGVLEDECRALLVTFFREMREERRGAKRTMER